MLLVLAHISREVERSVDQKLSLGRGSHSEDGYCTNV